MTCEAAVKNCCPALLSSTLNSSNFQKGNELPKFTPSSSAVVCVTTRHQEQVSRVTNFLDNLPDFVRILLTHFVTLHRVLIPQQSRPEPGRVPHYFCLVVFLSSSEIAASLRAEPLSPSIRRTIRRPNDVQAVHTRSFS